ncbi:Uncharacterised protein [Mycobacteroides abscessus subsp. abscessus]|nr:Uncharacterised protein [Mycobacteroides abscessus subsp. abscessus]
MASGSVWRSGLNRMAPESAAWNMPSPNCPANRTTANRTTPGLSRSAVRNDGGCGAAGQSGG